MSKLKDAQRLLNTDEVVDKPTKPKKERKKHNRNIWWSVGAYGIQTASVGVPLGIITTLNDAWVKTSLGANVILLAVALMIVYKKPIGAFRQRSPGTLPFALFVIVGMFFQFAADSFLMIGAAGLGGSLIATPLHMKYESTKTEKVDKINDGLIELFDRLKKL